MFKIIVSLKKIFNFFAIEKENEKLLSIRQFFKIAKELEFLDNKLIDIDKTQIEIIFFKKALNKMANFENFIEILFKIHKIYRKKNENTLKSKKKMDKYATFKQFLEEFLIKKFKIFSNKFFLFGIEKIQVFFNNYNPYHNASIGLFYECDDFLKHVFYKFSI